MIRNNLMDAVTAIQLSKKTYSKIKQNFAWAFGYNAVLIPIAAGVLAPIGIVMNSVSQPQLWLLAQYRWFQTRFF